MPDADAPSCTFQSGDELVDPHLFPTLSFNSAATAMPRSSAEVPALGASPLERIKEKLASVDVPRTRRNAA